MKRTGAESYLTVAEAARLAGLTEATIRGAIQRRRLPVTRVQRTRRVYITRGDLDVYRQSG